MNPLTSLAFLRPLVEQSLVAAEAQLRSGPLTLELLGAFVSVHPYALIFFGDSWFPNPMNAPMNSWIE